MPRRQDERDEVFAVEPPVGRSLRAGRDFARGEAVKFGDVVHHDGQVVGVGEQIVLELGRQRRQAAVELAEPRLRGIVEPGAGEEHLGAAALDEVALVVAEVEAVALRVQRVDAGKQGCIEADGVFVGREKRGVALFQCVRRVIRVSARLVEEHAQHAPEQLPTALERLDRVRERGLIRLRGDRLDLAALLGHAGLDRLGVVIVGDLGEGRQLVRERTRSEERIGHDSHPRVRPQRTPCKVHIAKKSLQRSTCKDVFAIVS